MASSYFHFCADTMPEENPASYSEFRRFCGMMGFCETPIGELLYNKLANIFDFDDIYRFACDVDNGAVDDATINILSAMDSCGTVGYGMARTYATLYDKEPEFLKVYGIVGDWEDVENGEPIGIDVGELLVWLDS